MGSEADQEPANAASPVDSDGSVSWEDFFGTSTDLVPQLLGMFDELARRPNGCTDVVLPEILQKRLSLRGPILEQATGNGTTTMEPSPGSAGVKRPEEKLPYRRDSSSLSPLRYGRRCRNAGRPLSGSSVASSTSSSGCSNQGNVCAVNPYLASVESLADTCASSQGSGDSGVATVSEASCRVGGQEGADGQRRDSGEEETTTTQKPRYCDPHRNPVERVLLEIVDTEAIYVEHLRQVIQGYLIYWRNDPTAFAQRMQLTDLFSNIEDIFEFNREFLKEIEKCGLDPVCVANTFIKHNSGFKVYTEYCTNYPRTVSVLTDLMSQDETADMFKERQAALGHALPLGSFLLKPVQRILKYHLLLENLSKEYGDEEEDGRAAIAEALDAMTGIAKHINAMKRRHEHAVRVQEIQSLLYGWPGPDLTTSGELVAEGRFRMRGAKAPRHAFLFDRMLLLTKKKEDGLLVYKAHIMCSNLMLIESIPGEPLSFHVIPFDNPRLQYTLQARNLEQKREWTLQIKRVILENYNVVIPSHARELVLQLGQTQPEEDALAEKGSARKQQQYSAPEYLEKRKQERERRRSETGLRQKFKKAGRKSETPTEDSPASPRKNQAEDSRLNDAREPILNRYSDGRGSKVKDRFTGWRRKSEPGFQSYVSLTQSDEERKDQDEEPPQPVDVETRQTDEADKGDLEQPSGPEESKKKEQTVEEIVGHILMQSQEFQKLLGKKQQRFNKRIQMDTSDESEREDEDEYRKKGRARREQRLVRANNAWNNFQRDSQQLRLLYEDLRTEGRSQGYGGKGKVVQERRAMFEAFKRQSIVTDSKVIKTALRIRENNEEMSMERERETLEKIEGRCEARKESERGLESKKGREALGLGTERDLEGERVKVEKVKEDDRWTTENQNKRGEQMERSGEKNGKKLSDNPRKLNQRDLEQNDKTRLKIRQKETEKDQTKRLNDQEDTFGKDSDRTERRSDDCQTVRTPEVKGQESEKKLGKGFGNYDNLQHVWDVLREEKDLDGNESPIRPAVWLTKLCEGLPTSPQKCGSLPRSFQINQEPNTQIGKSRFLQRDGKPMSERPFTIASDKPAEINLEDMERYASSCQPEERIAKFPTSSSSNLSSNSTFFYSLDMHISSTTNIHPDHKIYRANTAGTTLKNVLSKASTRLQGLRNTMSTETLECSEEIERTRYFRSLSASKLKKKGKSRHSRESSSDVEELIGCGTRTIDFRSPPPLYYKQGSSDLGARIAQSDYADPSVLFGGCKRYQKVVQDSKDTQQGQQTALQSQTSQQTTQQQVQSCSMGREVNEMSHREACTSNQKTDRTSPEDQNCQNVAKDSVEGDQGCVADVEGRLANPKGPLDGDEPLYSNQFLKKPLTDQGDRQNIYQSDKRLHQAQQYVLPGPQEVTGDHHDQYRDPAIHLKVHLDHQSYHRVLKGPLDHQVFQKPLKSPVALPKDAKDSQEPRKNRQEETRKQIQPSVFNPEDHQRSPSRRCFDNQQDRNPVEEVHKEARRPQKDWQARTDEHQEAVSETDSFYERSFETIENYVDEEDAFRDSAIFSDAEDPARPVQEPQETRRPVPVPVGRRKEAGRKPSVARKPEFLKPRFLEGQETRNGLERTAGDPGKEEEDVSEGQSQAGWVRKIVGQLQAHIET